MSLRLPQSLSSDLRAEASALDREILAEKAASLGRAGREVERTLSALASCPDASKRPALVQAAADAAYGYMVQRELCGLLDHRAVIEQYAIPPEVLARVGARRTA